MPTLFTLGHSDRNEIEFVELLDTIMTRTLVDIRAYPYSHRNPQFAKDNLRSLLQKNNILYHWAGRQLGGARKNARNTRHCALGNEDLRAFADYMDTAPFKHGASQLINLAGKSNTVILCAEKDPEKCHRSLISDYFLLRGFQVVHLLDINHQNEHQLHHAARRESSDLVYDRVAVDFYNVQ